MYKYLEYIDKNLEVKYEPPVKPTARCPTRYVCESSGKDFLLVIAATDIQKFYLKRSICKQKDFFLSEFGEYFSFNMPVVCGQTDAIDYAIYEYFNDAKICKRERAPINFLKKIYKKHAKYFSMNSELLTKIKHDFLSAWPNDFHERIASLDLFKIYFNEIEKLKTVQVFKEHGDFAVNNILYHTKKFWLMDFEFSRDFQVTGFDAFLYNRTCRLSILRRLLIRDSQQKMHVVRYALLDAINEILDKPFFSRSDKS